MKGEMYGKMEEGREERKDEKKKGSIPEVSGKVPKSSKIVPKSTQKAPKTKPRQTKNQSKLVKMILDRDLLAMVSSSKRLLESQNRPKFVIKTNDPKRSMIF